MLTDLLIDGVQFDSCVTDPPYHLTSVVKRFGSATAAPAQHGTDGAFARASRGFMGKEWDGGDIAFQPDTWRQVYDVLKPGAYLAAFGGTRTAHRMAVAIEDAGFEIRDTLMWLYGTGFPKSHDVAKGIDKLRGAPVKRMIPGADQHKDGWIKDDGRTHTPGEYEPATPEAAAWQGWGTALKPAVEPIILARKPLIGTVAANVAAFGTGGINIDACRVPGESTVTRHTAEMGYHGGNLAAEYVTGSDSGRWPANILHDGSPEVLAAFAQFGDRPGGTGPASRGAGGISTNGHAGQTGLEPYRERDSGSAARFFYCAKAGKADRAGSKHPTVKPQSLMRWLTTLITPPGGHVLDLFAGSGSTLQAACDLGFSATGIERDPEYQADIARRIAAMESLYA